MAEVGNLTATLSLDASGFEKGIDQATKQTNLFADVLGANLATKAIGLAVDGLKRLADAAADTFKESVKGFADFEQLVGGVETLFKDSAKTVEKYAEQAFETAGLSANEYMETVTSFSASLIQSLEGDTAQAAEMANMAITDMADNANKMGSDMASIQNAYQGFAKQNFTMLDNLKLGYGGTQAEMYRLMEDAAALDTKFAETAQFSMDSSGHLVAGFADIVEAIHIVQTEMGITGTTAAEASNTVSGSISAMKAAWKNLINGLGNDKADLDKLIDDFFEKANNAWEKLEPVAERVLDGMIQLVIDGLPKFVDLGIKIAGAILKGMLKILLKPLTWIADKLSIGLTGYDLSGNLGGVQDWDVRASGGPVTAGTPYMTGELGPELFVPKTDGYVLNHEDTESLASGFGGITININGDVYDDEMSMREKVSMAVRGVLETELAYG